MNEILLMSAKIIFLFLFTLLCFRLMGYRSIGDMEPLDYVIVLGIGEIMGSPISGKDLNVLEAMVAIATLTVLQIGFSALYNRAPRLGRMMDGGPVPVIRDGKLLEKNLAKHRLSAQDVMEELRIKGLRDESDVDVANLEPSGRFSVILKNEAAPVTPRFLELETSLLLAAKGKVNPSEWERGEISSEQAAAFLAAAGVRNWQEVDTLVYKNGRFLLKRRED